MHSRPTKYKKMPIKWYKMRFSTRGAWRAGIGVVLVSFFKIFTHCSWRTRNRSAAAAAPRRRPDSFRRGFGAERKRKEKLFRRRTRGRNSSGLGHIFASAVVALFAYRQKINNHALASPASARSRGGRRGVNRVNSATVFRIRVLSLRGTRPRIW